MLTSIGGTGIKLKSMMPGWLKTRRSKAKKEKKWKEKEQNAANLAAEGDQETETPSANMALSSTGPSQDEEDDDFINLTGMQQVRLE